MSKSKKGIFAIVFALLLLLSFGLFFFVHKNPTIASAQPEYHWLKFSYEQYEVSVIDGTKKKLSSSTGTYGGQFKFGRYNTGTLGVKIYKTDYDLNKWDYRYDLNPKEGLIFGDISVNVFTGGYIAWTIEAYDDSTGRKLGSSNTAPLNLNYPEGHYTIKFSATGPTCEYGNGSEKIYYLVEGKGSFIVDLTAPYIEGADPEGQERWVTVGHTIYAKDLTSDIKCFYKSTEEGKFYTYQYQVDSYTFTEKDKNGHYGFYCVDWSTNTAEKRWLYFDGVKPTGTISTEDGEVESGSTVKKAFSFSATDDYSGIEKLHYKTPASTQWQNYVEGTKIPASSAGGTYYFRCADRAGNENVYSVVLDSVLAHTHSNVKKSEKNATCTEDGYIEYECSECKEITRTTELKLGHDYKSSKKITCTGETTTYICSRCNDSYSESTGSGSGHSYVATTTAATCTSGGYTTYKCSQCGDSYKDKATSALGHNYSTTKKTTCTGETIVYTCLRCNYSYSESSGDGYGHSYTAKTTAATCTSSGFTVYTCSRCGVSYKDTISQPLGHSYSTSKRETCTGETTVYTCTRCNYSYSDSSGNGSGHTYVATITEATCTEGGYTIYKCSRCGDSYRDNESQPLGHNFITETKPATCTDFGKTVYTCQICDYFKEESDGTYPTGHSYTSTVTKAPTCTADGLRKSICDICGEITENRIAAQGHHYALTGSSKSSGNTLRTYSCSVCGDSYTQELGNQYEQVANYVEYLFEQYSPYMFWVLLATAGLWSIAIGIFIIIAVRNDEKAKAKKMLVNYLVGLIVIAVIVVACPYLIRGIATLVS